MDKTFNAAEAEARIYAEWEARGCFAAGIHNDANTPNDDTFCIVIPPPNVTGSLHMGHALNNTLQDILVRWHRMRGFDTLWQPGTDHAGIATQMVVERRLAEEGDIRRTDMTRGAFIERVWQQKAESEGVILGQLKRLGASADWSRTEFTMSDNLSAAVLKVFVQLYNEGLIYKGKRLVNWDPHFETAISDLEVENVEVDGHFWHFKYPLAGGETYEYIEKDEDGTVTLRETRDYISIATTRPETMLGDGAVAVHPSDERYAPIVGKQVHLPLCDRTIPIITDEYPDPDFGSGAVKITGAHDFNDYAVARRNDIPLYNLMTTKAAMRDDEADDNLVPEKYRGMSREEARKAVVADIDALGLMIMVEDKKITQPKGDRSKVVIEPYLTDQWFVDAKTLAQPALEAVRGGQTTFAPKNWEKTYFQWLDNIEPWCISRQLWWGHQVPVWYAFDEDWMRERLSDGKPGREIVHNASTTKRFCFASEQEALAAARASYSSDIDVRVFEGSDLPGAAFGRDQNGTIYVEIGRDPDVLDTWFSSALWPFSTLGWPEETPELDRYYKTDVLITGFDIIFFWVARMMMMGTKFMGEVPFHTVYVHALVRDAEGKKMSKSLGNVIDPLELIDEYGADAVRFTLTSMAAMGRDIKLDVNRVAGYRNFGTKLWNAARFAEMNGCYADIPDYTTRITKAVSNPDESGIKAGMVNRWIISETVRVAATVDEALTAYRFNDAASALYAHIWGTFCDWYVELSKPLLQGDDAAAKAETQATMAWALDQCLILLHPLMPFVTEELWGALTTRETPLIHAKWPDFQGRGIDEVAEAEMRWVIRAIEGIRSARTEMNVPAGAKIEMVLTGHNGPTAMRLLRNAPLIQRLARLSECAVAEVAPEGSVTVPMEDCTINLPLAGVIDVAAEVARLQKSHAKVAKEVKGLTGKLSNEAFLAKAPDHVVAEQRERLAAAEGEVAKIDAALSRLAALSDGT